MPRHVPRWAGRENAPVASSLRGGELHDEAGAAEVAALGGDRAARRLDEAPADCQSEAGAFSDILAGGERLEQPRLDLPGNARPVVLDLDADPAAPAAA